MSIKSASHYEQPDEKWLEFVTMDDMMITGVLIDRMVIELGRLSESIEEKVKENYYTHSYFRKKNLISKYLECSDPTEKERLKEDVVSVYLYIYDVKPGFFFFYFKPRLLFV